MSEQLLVSKQEREAAMTAMAPIEIGRALYERAGRDDFDADVAEHLYNAFVISNPRHFMMFRVVEGPAWLINSAVSKGDLSELLALLPFRLDYICFHRRNDSRLRVYKTERIERLLKK